MNKRAVGTEFEQRAADYLRRNGYRLLQHNFRCRVGEIDLVARNDGYLCFVEVKYRANTAKGFPSEAITPIKMRRLSLTAENYLLLHRLPADTPCRFDVVVILGQDISLIKNAFDGVR